MASPSVAWAASWILNEPLNGEERRGECMEEEKMVLLLLFFMSS